MMEGMIEAGHAKVAVVCGGPGAEAEVSRSSGAEVASALAATYEQVIVLELDRRIARELEAVRPDVVFPVLHGPPGEDGTLQGLLEILELPFVGSTVLSSACSMDKAVSKQIFRANGLPVAQDVVVRRSEGATAAAERVVQSIGADVVAKPASQGSAVGVAFAENERTLVRALARAFTFDERALVEERIAGREITVGILERNGPEAFPVIEVRTPEGSWYDYEHRYTSGMSEHVIPAPLPEGQYSRTQDLAIRAHEALGCRDLSRVDFVAPEQGPPIVLEVNTLPGMTPTSLYPDAARAAGLSFEELVAHLVQCALIRSQRR